jgi:Ion transport protein/Cyclic nucleotide-binding domain
MIYTVTITPYRVAFVDVETLFWLNLDYVIDIIFGIDVVLNCFMAYFSDEVLITSRCKIILNYARTWMVFDIISSIPFDLIIDKVGWGSLTKLSKLPRLYRIVKLIKLVRLIKVLKNRNKILRYLECFSKLSVGMERLIYFLLTFFVICHLIACFLYFISTFNSDNINNWVFKYGILDLSLEEKYLASMYWTVMTLCTIGYGDIVPASDIERGLVIFVELSGVFFYSYTIGTITSVMAEMDKKKSKLDSKIMVLQEISKKYNLNPKFYKKLKSALEYSQDMVNKERTDMMAILPKKLSIKLSLLMNQSLIETNKFFENKQIKFITTVIECLKPLKIKPKEVIYRKGEFTEEIFFIKTGEVVFYETQLDEDIPYEVLIEGDYFGDIEVFLSEVREYSVKALKLCQLYTLSKEELFNNVLFYFEDLKLSMIIDANNHKDILNKKKEKALSNNYEKSFSIPHENSENLRDVNIIPSSDFHRKEYANLRKTLAPGTRAMLEENDEASVVELKLELDTLAIEIGKLEDLIYNNKPNISIT